MSLIADYALGTSAISHWLSERQYGFYTMISGISALTSFDTAIDLIMACAAGLMLLARVFHCMTRLVKFAMRGCAMPEGVLKSITPFQLVYGRAVFQS